MGAHRAKKNANYMQLIRMKINLGIFFYYDDFFRKEKQGSHHHGSGKYPVVF